MSKISNRVVFLNGKHPRCISSQPSRSNTSEQCGLRGVRRSVFERIRAWIFGFSRSAAIVSQTTSETETNADNYVYTSSAAGRSANHDKENDTDSQGNTTEDFKELKKLKSSELEKPLLNRLK